MLELLALVFPPFCEEGRPSRQKSGSLGLALLPQKVGSLDAHKLRRMLSYFSSKTEHQKKQESLLRQLLGQEEIFVPPEPWTDLAPARLLAEEKPREMESIHRIIKTFFINSPTGLLVIEVTKKQKDWIVEQLKALSDERGKYSVTSYRNWLGKRSYVLHVTLLVTS